MTPAPAGAHVRRLWPAERGLYEAHLRRLDAESRRMRFGVATNDDGLKRLAEASGPLNAVVHAAFADGAVRGVSELRPISGTWPTVAEVAVSVESGYRRRGLARALLHRAVTTARNRGIRRLILLCMEENVAIRRLARSLGAVLATDTGDVEGRLEAPVASVFSVFGEWLDDAFSFNRYVLDL